MIKKIFKWLAKIFGISTETPFEIVDNLDLFVKDKLNLMLEEVNSFDIATGYFQISGWQAFSEQVKKLIEKGGKVRILIGDLSKEYLLPQTARFLLSLIKNPYIEARTIKPRLLHAKLFMAKAEKELKVLFGSSNVTFGGMEANIELNTYEVLNLDSKKAKSLIEWYEKLWESAIPIDEELEAEIILASHKEEKKEVLPIIEDQNKALFLSLLIKDLARIDLRDIGNFVPLKFQYIDAVAGIHRFFLQPGGKRGVMFAHEVGLGKTIISGMILKHLLFNGHIKNALIIAPLSIIRQWMEDLRIKFNIKLIEITSRIIKGFKPSNFNVYIISYDLLREHIDIFHKDWDFIVIDESHFIRNSWTQRFRAVKELKSKFHLLLTATPIHNRIEDIVTQLYLFVPEEIISKATKKEISKIDRTKLFKTFVKRRLQKDALSDILSERNVLPPEIITLSEKEKEIYESLKDFLSQKSKYYQIISRSIEHIAPFIKERYLEEFVSSKEACLFALSNLKDRINEAINKGVIEYNFGILKKESEGSIIDEIRSFVEDELEAQSKIEVSRDEEGNLIVKLLIDEKIKEELKSDIEFLNKLIKEIEKIDQFSKVKRVIELIEKLKPSKENKIIVFVGFIKTGEKITEILKNKGIKAGFFYGELGEAQREKLIEKLWEKEEERIDVLVSTDAAYVGLNLQIANTIINHDLSWNPMVVEQRIGRIHRIGQKKPVTSYSFLCENTIDKRKHEILTVKLKEITTHFGMSYSVVLSEVALSSEIEKIMAQLELKEIDDKILEEKLKKHITDRKEIFELLEELPTEEKEIFQIGFTNKLIEKIEDILGDLIKIGREMLDFKIEPIIEDNKFFILSYKKNGKAVKELSTLNEKALINVNPENVKEWKEKYGFENIDPYYVGPFHYLIENISELCIKKNSGKFWKKETSDVQAIAFYTLFPLKIINLSAEINISFDVFVPVLYKPVNKEIKIDALKVYDLAIMEGRVKEIGEDDKILIKEAKEIFDKEIKNIKGKIEADIKKIKIEVEELILQKQREELEKKIKEILERLEKLRREIHRKQSSGLRYDEEMKEAKKLKEKLDNFLKAPKAVPESSLNIEFGEPKIIGGCIYHP
jgi:SNF2 family DNA or RNA helicase/DNA-directed RNA polymerase subunit H (RpoH/RPB5)